MTISRRVPPQQHPVTLAPKEQCCGMPKLELGDRSSINQESEYPALAMVDQATTSSRRCRRALMFKQDAAALSG
jgi:hypothetical protein